MMTIKHHEMHYDEDGNLVDDDLESHDSANSRFARTLTENYDQISRHYPILARLKPLLKLGLIINIINNIYENVKANNEHDYDDGLTKMKNELKDYPLYSSNKVESEIDKLCNQQGLSKYKISNLSQIRTDITGQLREADDKIVNNIVNMFKSSLKINFTSGEVDKWLRSNHNRDITNKIQRQQIAALDKFKRGIDFVNLNPDHGTKSTNLDEPCLVPAVFGVDDDSRVYGGVNMGINPQQTNNVQYRKYIEVQKVR